MPVFKSHFLKYFKAKLTWIIFALTISLIILLSYLAFANNNYSNHASSAYLYARHCSIFLSFTLPFFAALTCIFAAFFGAALFREEIEDQSFLIIISKRCSRFKILLAKLLALWSWIIIYTGMMSLTLVICILSFDQSKQISNLRVSAFPVPRLSKSAWTVGLIAWAIWLSVCNFLVSFSVLFSVKFSAKATIGATISWGVVIPFTSMIGLFLPQASYHNTIAKHLNSLVRNVDNLNQHFNQEVVDPLNTDLLEGIDDLPTLYNLGLSTNKKDHFPKAWFFDFNFQLGTLATFALDQVFSLSIQNYLEPRGGYTFLRNQVIKNPDFLTLQNSEEPVAYFDQLIINSWNTLAPLRAGLIKYLNQILLSFPPDFTMKTTPFLDEALTNLKISPSDTLNQLSLKQMASYDYQNQEVQEQVDYFQMLYAFIAYYDQVKLDFSPAVFNAFEDSRQVLDGMHIIEALNIAIHTCNWLDSKIIDQTLTANQLKVDDSFGPANYQQSLPLKLIADNLDQQHIYQKIRTLLANNVAISKISARRYVDPWVIMSIYLIVSFLFFTCAFYVMSKQDIK